MRYHWYIAGADELFADVDCKPRDNQRLVKIRARLRGAKAAGALNWESAVFYSSETPYHYHLMVRLQAPMRPDLRLLWESRLGDDMFRNQMNTARLIETGRSWSLFITPSLRSSYHRPPDFQCECPAKHKIDVMKQCPVARKLKCTYGANHFGDPIILNDPIVLGRPFVE